MTANIEYRQAKCCLCLVPQIKPLAGNTEQGELSQKKNNATSLLLDTNEVLES